MTDEKGTVKYTYTYNPYGELTKGSYGQVMFLFNGQYGVASDDNGLYYMRARYYNVSIKRFINQDVVTGSIAESQSLNRYAYVEGNPVSYLDPLGLERAFIEYGREWYPLKSGYFFSETKYGGKLKVSIDFFSNNTCLTVAQDIIDEGLITGMGKTEIDLEHGGEKILV